MPDPLPILPNALIVPEKTITGRGSVSRLLVECERFGKRGILLYGSALAHRERMIPLLSTIPKGMVIRPIQHSGDEPTLSQVAVLVSASREHRADWIAGVGGGSIMDLAKAGAALINATEPITRYHDGAPLPDTGLAFIAVPTTAGTGAEATLNSVLTNEVTGVKKSIRAPGMMARVVILDPSLLAGCPKGVIAASGMDALTQAIESYTSRNATWLSDTLSLRAISLIANHLEPVWRDSEAPSAEPLLIGSYLAGVALSFARLGIVHGIAHPLGTLYDLPHGVVCAACLPHAVKLNRDAFGAKYDVLGEAMGGDLQDAIRKLMNRLDMTSPFTGKSLREKDMIIQEALASGSTKANPKLITRADVEWLLGQLF